jgi:hypothetical protein
VQRRDLALEVLRVEIAAADGDQLLQPPGDEQLPVVAHAEVAGAQERALAVRGPGPEDPLGQLGLPPVAGGHARPAQPDLADLTVGQRLAGVGVDDPGVDAGRHRAAAHHRPARLIPAARHEPVLLEQLGAHPGDHRLAPATGDEHGRLRQAVAREDRLWPQPGRRQVIREVPQRQRGDGLGAVAGVVPAGQVQPRHPLR